MLQENGYPKSYFDETIKKFLTEQDAKEKTIPNTFEKESYYITIPCLESESPHFTNNLNKAKRPSPLFFTQNGFKRNQAN